MQPRLSLTRRIALGAILTALTMITLYFAGTLPTGRIALYVLSSIFIAAAMVEGDTRMAVLVYLASSSLGLLIIPNKLRMIPYAAILGYYAIVKYYIEKRLRFIPGVLIKLLLANVAAVAIWYIFESFIPDMLRQWWWAYWLGFQPVVILYDLLFTQLIGFYQNKIRSRLR